ncbi:MAG: two-component sensor histidine kinase [Deltaproteobacteria bacterium]|nr:two-component sensor histidine kinase [Deltaproteobacteria bacterium]MBW2101356.1 two-component sensor histidine kinase [Deltaproteobacteria bacterium]
MRRLLFRFSPQFLDAGSGGESRTVLFNYRRIWLVSVLLLLAVSILPMGLLVIISSQLAREAIGSENRLRAVRLTSNTRRTISFFLEERLDALRFIARQESFRGLNSELQLAYLLRDLQMGFGGFVDLGLINADGLQVRYAGPFDLTGKNYGGQEWFRVCVEKGFFISDIFLGFRQIPHMIIALKVPKKDGSFYLLRATLDTRKIIRILSSLELSEGSDAFLCNREGLIQTPSKYYGNVLQRFELGLPGYSPRSRVIEARDRKGKPILIGYAYIKDSPYVLILVKRGEEIMKGWFSLRTKINWIFFLSIITVCVVVLGISTFMVNRVYENDQARLRAMERLEASSRLISIGRLAAGVAHEINNPLAIISENAGLMKDLFTLKKEYREDPQLMGLVDDVLESVERCGEITKQLLGFARHVEARVTPIRLEEVVAEVISFLKKEASYRKIEIQTDIPSDFPVVFLDRGKLQQILLNLVNNAFQAMDDGGRLQIKARERSDGRVEIEVRDTGCGISEEDQKKIFEPFFTTKGTKGGTGLGLSITYGLVQKLKGDIKVRSALGKGTTFTIVLPLKIERKEDEGPACG